MAKEDGLNLKDATVGQLGKLRDTFKRNANAETKAAKAKGGVGTNKLDDSAREFTSKLLSVQRELNDRLLDVFKERSLRSRTADRARQATKTMDPRKWIKHPAKYDYPGIDTKK